VNQLTAWEPHAPYIPGAAKAGQKGEHVMKALVVPFGLALAVLGSSVAYACPDGNSSGLFGMCIPDFNPQTLCFGAPENCWGSQPPPPPPPQHPIPPSSYYGTPQSPTVGGLAGEWTQCVAWNNGQTYRIVNGVGYANHCFQLARSCSGNPQVRATYYPNPVILNAPYTRCTAI